MLKIIASIFTILILSVFLNACKNNSTNPSPLEINTNFPNGDGSTYKFSVEKTDSNGTQTAGTRNTDYAGTQVKNNTAYQVQIDSFNLSGVSEISLSYFRKANDGVFYFLDTTGLTSFIPAIYLSYLHIDSEMRELLFPLVSGSSWPVFKLTLNYQIFNLTIIDFSANYVGKESVLLHLTSGDLTKEAIKIKYTLNLTIPNSTNTNTYSAYAWFVDGIGIVKWQGSGVILNAFAGGGVDLTDTTSVITQSLISYNLK